MSSAHGRRSQINGRRRWAGNFRGWEDLAQVDWQLRRWHPLLGEAAEGYSRANGDWTTFDSPRLALAYSVGGSKKRKLFVVVSRKEKAVWA